MKKVLVLVASAVVAVSVPAYAADAATTSDTTVSLAPLVGMLSPYLTQLVGIAVTAIVGWIAKKFNDNLGLQIDANMRAALHSAAMTGATKAVAGMAGPLGSVKIDVGSPFVKTGVDWVMSAVPGAIKYFNMSPDAVADLVQSKFGALQASSEVVDSTKK